MCVYRERLGVPLWSWLVVTACIVVFGSGVWAGFSLTVAALVYIGLEAVAAAILLTWGWARIEVTADTLGAGRHRLPLAEVAAATALDRDQFAALRGPRADPAAMLLLRPWLPLAVFVQTPGRPAGQPYWLLATRHPGQLAAAIEQARNAALVGGPAGHADGGDAPRRAPDAVG